jgi:hypothetical protein
MSATKQLSRAAGEHFQASTQFSFEDAMQRRLRYHLLRLTAVGLTADDVRDLSELGRLAFQDSDVTEQSTKIKRRAEASPLAFAIADILERAGSASPSSVRLRTVMLGAVLGAYTALGDLPGDDRSAAAVLGAVGGAVAASTSAVVLANIDQLGSADYLDDEG